MYYVVTAFSVSFGLSFYSHIEESIRGSTVSYCAFPAIYTNKKKVLQKSTSNFYIFDAHVWKQQLLIHQINSLKPVTGINNQKEYFERVDYAT